MTPAEQLGYKVGDKFQVISDEGSSYYKIGMVVVLAVDDNSVCPWFRYVSGPKGRSLGSNDEICVELEEIKPLDNHVEKLETKDVLKEYIKVKYPSDTFLMFLVDNS